MPSDPIDNAFTPQLQRAFDYWNGKRAGRPMPSRTDIDPLDIPDLLPCIQLIDVVPPHGRFYVRLVGTEICRRFGNDYTGKFLDEIDFGDVTGNILDDYARAASNPEPYVTRHRFRKSDEDFYFNIQRAIFPLSSDGEIIDKLLALLDFSLEE